MAEIFNFIRKIFEYAEPLNQEAGFEFTEDRYETSSTSNTQSIDWRQLENKAKAIKDGKNKADIKIPLKIKDCNELKNSKSETSANISRIKNGFLSKDFQLNIEYFKSRFNIPTNQVVIIKEFNIALDIKACIVYIDGLVDHSIINQMLLARLMDQKNFKSADKTVCVLEYVMNNVLSVKQVRKEEEIEKIVTCILSGITALFVDNCDACLLVETIGYEERSVEKPHTEDVVRGPQRGFTENLRTNISLISRIIRNENLITEMIRVGDADFNHCAVIYFKGIANPRIVEEAKRRLRKINIDFILSDGMLEQLIEDRPFNILPQVLSTERPDRASSFIMEGQVVILTEGAPFALIVPVTFFHLLQTSEDSEIRWQYGTFFRLIRLLGLFVATFLPGLYIALTLYHHEMIPTPILSSIIKAREGVPFPAVVEILLMEFAFELIREGGIRIPGVIGHTLGIVGALILGQSAVAAGLVSSILIIIVAVAGLGSFTIPNYSLSIAIRIIRFMFIFLSSILGFYGIAVGVAIFGASMCHIKSFGVPFLSPISPRTKKSRDMLIRYPIFMQRTRPDNMNTTNKKRTGNNPRGWERTNSK